MAMQPFIWGNGGEQLTPQQVERRRIAALLQSQRASDTSPVGHWTQAAARGLNGFLAGRTERNADRQENAGLASADAAIQGNPVLSALMGGQQMPAMMPGAAAGPVQPMAEGMPSGGLPASIVQSESGGNWNALNSEGYGGRGQFGEARLADAARAGVIPAGMTGAMYSQASPEVQTAVENWHKQDILNSLGQYVGVDPDGPGPIPALTPDSLLAVAHLGGTGGARRFVESGGQYNPSDSNGTSLADYAIRHAGGPQAGAMPAGMAGSMPQAPSGVVAALTAAQSNPWVAQKYGPVIDALMQQEMGRQDASYQQQMAQQDPMYQAQLEAAQIANQQAMMPQAPELISAGGGNLYDPATGQWVIAPRGPQEPLSGLGKLEADREAGLISDEAYQAELASMAPQGMSIESDGAGGFRMVQGAGAGDTRPFTEGQSKDNVYVTRAEGALSVLDPIASSLTSRTDRAAEMVPFGLARGAQSDRFQMAKNSGDEFLQAILRKDTGAAITEQEQALYGVTYLPQPGDSEAVQQQKVLARRRAVEAIKSGQSPSQLLAVERALQASGSQQLQPVGSPAAPAAPAAEAPARDFRAMTPGELATIDLGTLSDAELDAYLEATQ